LQGGYKPVSGSIFYWPGGSGGFKGGLYIGSPGVGLLLEGYTRIWDCNAGWFPDIRESMERARNEWEEFWYQLMHLEDWIKDYYFRRMGGMY